MKEFICVGQYVHVVVNPYLTNGFSHQYHLGESILFFFFGGGGGGGGA